MGRTKRAAALPPGFEPQAPEDYNAPERPVTAAEPTIANQAAQARHKASQRVNELTIAMMTAIEEDDFSQLTSMLNRQVLYSYIAGLPLNSNQVDMVNRVLTKTRSVIETGPGSDLGALADELRSEASQVQDGLGVDPQKS